MNVNLTAFIDRRNLWPRLLNGSKIFVRISSRKHDEMSSFRLNNGLRLRKTNRAAIRWKQPPKKPSHHVSRDKILHDSWSISAALAMGFSDCHFERGEGPGDEVEERSSTNFFHPPYCVPYCNFTKRERLGNSTAELWDIRLACKVWWDCPFRGCAGDWVKLGVAKRHGAVWGTPFAWILRCLVL